MNPAPEVMSPPLTEAEQGLERVGVVLNEVL
jgi:hypothetical protein